MFFWSRKDIVLLPVVLIAFFVMPTELLPHYFFSTALIVFGSRFQAEAAPPWKQPLGYLMMGIGTLWAVGAFIMFWLWGGVYHYGFARHLFDLVVALALFAAPFGIAVYEQRRATRL